MNRFALSVSLLALASIAPQALAGPVTQPTTQQAQAMLDKLVQEPLKFEGASDFPLGFRQAPGYQGRQPTRVLIGYHLDGLQITGEFVALDAENRPLQAAPLTGHLLEASRGETAVACRVDIALPSTLHLSGMCGPALISGAYSEKVKAQPLMFLLPGLGEGANSSGEYLMKPWRG
ncbi:hypothetical protein [Asaia spathodeae]|uniref:Uncharacterized protein n=1 Tax=Asaia spathodeae TaxID=657016 RepID=A0ABX2P8F7_9PROT|nr:hypothetical protein [Asaia spathodeae]GBR12614.1 hypothetical protein AA105894_0575 [Asaia spathodeae NBRC 105894]